MSISVVVPTFDMAKHLPALWVSFERAGLFAVVSEIIIVDDGSTDETWSVLQSMTGGPHGEKLKPLRLPRNRGRFLARLEGARAASSERILFLDTRLVLPESFGRALARAATTSPSVMGVVDIDVTRSIFCLYWDRSHRRIFKKHYDATTRPETKHVVMLDAQNYDEYLKGTGVFLCERALFLETCAKFDDLFSDDTYLMREMVRKTPIRIDPDVRVQWVPREDAKGFLRRILERGPGFVEYHVIERRGAFFWAVVAGGVVLASGVALAFFSPPLGAMAFAGALSATALSTSLFATSVSEAVRMAPLHVAVVTTFGASVLLGLAANASRGAKRAWARHRDPRGSPAGGSARATVR